MFTCSPTSSSSNSFSSNSVTSQSRLIPSPDHPNAANVPPPLVSRPSKEKLAERRKRLKKTRSVGNLLRLADSEESLKLALYYHICNPLKRWKTERKVPYSLLLQLFKAFFVMLQASKKTRLKKSIQNYSLVLHTFCALFKCKRFLPLDIILLGYLQHCFSDLIYLLHSSLFFSFFVCRL